MERIEIRDIADAKALRSRFREETVAFLMPETRVGPATALPAVVGTAMNGIEVDVDALLRADKELETAQHELLRHLERAGRLTDHLGDGESPISAPMRQAFADRADAEGGLQGTLEDYIEELTNVRIAIRETLAGYQDLDTDAAALLRSEEED